jgi:hypothetical protein
MHCLLFSDMHTRDLPAPISVATGHAAIAATHIHKSLLDNLHAQSDLPEPLA